MAYEQSQTVVMLSLRDLTKRDRGAADSGDLAKYNFETEEGRAKIFGAHLASALPTKKERTHIGIVDLALPPNFQPPPRVRCSFLIKRLVPGG